MAKEIDQIINIEELKGQAQLMGFAGIHARQTLARLNINPTKENNPPILESETRPIKPIDFGMVVVGVLDNPEDFNGYEITYKNGVPIPDESKIQEFNARNSNQTSSTKFDANNGPTPLYPFAKYGNAILAFPGKILGWSAGENYDKNHHRPFPGTKDPGFFDFSNLVYRTDKDFTELGYSEEGVRRQAMLQLMSHLVSFANGTSRVRINTEACEVYIGLDEEEVCKLDNQHGPVKAMLFDLSGINVVTGDSKDVHNLTALDDFDEADMVGSMKKAVGICRKAIIKDRNARPNITQGAQESLDLFDLSDQEI